jgi:hypothetical protein
MRSSIEIQRCKRVQMIFVLFHRRKERTVREPGMTERTVEHALPEILPIRIRRLILLKGFGVFEQPAVFHQVIGVRLPTAFPVRALQESGKLLLRRLKAFV